MIPRWQDIGAQLRYVDFLEEQAAQREDGVTQEEIEERSESLFNRTLVWADALGEPQTAATEKVLSLVTRLSPTAETTKKRAFIDLGVSVYVDRVLDAQLDETDPNSRAWDNARRLQLAGREHVANVMQELLRQ